MAKDTPSMAKNKMRRCFAAILDPHPSNAEVEELWSYFESKCAYCGTHIERKSRTGHLDHVLATSEGGTNSIHNHVLACARCNGDEKREESWVTFLLRKADTPSEASERKVKIELWLSYKSAAVDLSLEAKQAANEVIATAIESFDRAIERLREIRRRGT